ncbi:MAG: alpha/beta hydrolase [Woeseiaceae bacterium]|nr:alpha/beta hydrolase [Woeseiaceae bacterium]
MKKKLGYGLLLLVAVVAIYVVYLGVPRHDYFYERIGELESIADVESRSADAIRHSVELVSSSGLVVRLRVVRPLRDGTFPVVLVAGGHRTGKDAVDLAGAPTNIVYAAIDYPYTGNHEPRGFWASIRTVPQIQRAFLDTPPALALANSWLQQQPWVDKSGVELIGASLGAPFASVAGAIDDRFSRLWILHGGGDNVAWVSHVGRRHVDNETLRRGIARLALWLTGSFSFDTPEWIRRVSPRPVIIVSACDDDYVPREAQDALLATASSDHVEFVWVDGEHIRTGRAQVLQTLLDTVFNKIHADTLPASVNCD